MRRIYIHQDTRWPGFTWQDGKILSALTAVRFKQGRLRGQLEQLGFSVKDEAGLQAITLDVIKSSEIEGEKLDAAQVRSSVARHLGMDIAGLVVADRKVDGVVEMMLDATGNYEKTLTRDRLFAWHSALFPLSRTRLQNITVGDWRKDEGGPMQVISGAMGKEKVHFEAPPSKLVKSEMNRFLKWFNAGDTTDPVLRSALAHLWFVTIHPFDDGNGRMARALGDMLLARSEGDSRRYYSFSAQVRLERKQYYEILERTQKGNLDVTEWLTWYLQCLDRALSTTERKLKRVLNRTVFWDRHRKLELNTRQHKMINKLFEGLEGKLSTSKWAKMNKCSADTALRDIQDLVDKKILVKDGGGGRSTSYGLK